MEAFWVRPRVKRLDARYSVCEDGVVLSGGMSLKPVRGVWVSLYGERRLVCYLVARAFVPNPRGCRWVRHKNGVKEDNRACNLEWCDEKEPDRRRGRKPRMVAIGQFDAEGELVARYCSVAEAAKATGLDARAIRGALERKGRSGSWYWLYL